MFDLHPAPSCVRDIWDLLFIWWYVVEKIVAISPICPERVPLSIYAKGQWVWGSTATVSLSLSPHHFLSAFASTLNFSEGRWNMMPHTHKDTKGASINAWVSGED
ncbi:hypothetical protein Ancab_021524 [Ancistrocladus abbreviatus]